MQRTSQGRLTRCARLTCIALVGIAIWQPLPAVAALVTWGCAIALAGFTASMRVIGRLG